METLQLPLNLKPPILVYQYRAYPLSVTSNYSETETWLHSNFIHLKCNLNFIDDKVDMDIDFIAGSIYGGIPWLDYLNYDLYHTLDNEPYDVCSQIMSILGEGYYIYTFVDEFYIPSRHSYHKDNLTHDLLIHGYNLYTKSFKIVGFDDKRNYSESEVSFDELVCALKHSEKKYSKLIRMKNDCNYSFNKENVKDKLEDYIFSKNCAGNLLKYDFDNRTEYMDNLNQYLLIENWGFGMEIYKQFLLFNKVMSKNKINPDFRPIHCLWEHKKCMLERLKYLYRNAHIYDVELINSYQELLTKFNIGRIYFIKYYCTNDTRILERIETLIKDTDEEEIRILSRVIVQLKTY